MDFDSILKEMEKERQKAFEIRKKEGSKDKEKHEDEHNDSEEDRENTEHDETEDREEEHEDVEEEKDEDEDSKNEETDHRESEEQDESEEKDDEDDDVKEKRSEEDTEKDEEEHEEIEHVESEEQEEKEENSEVVEENKEEVVKEEAETTVETIESITEKTKTQKTTPSPVKPKLQSIKLNLKPTNSKNKQKDVIKMPEKIKKPQNLKIIKTTKIKRIIKQPAKVGKKIKISAASSAELKKLTKEVMKLKESLNKLLKTQKEKEMEQLRREKERINEAMKKEKERGINALEMHTKLKKELEEGLAKERQTIVNTVTSELGGAKTEIRKDISHFKEFQPEILFNSIQKLNENITEMNSLFRLAAELMQKPDPIQSKLKKLFDENEKIAQGILAVLDAVNEMKQVETAQVEDIKRIENEIRLPLRNIASRAQTEDMEAPSIPAPPPEFRESIDSGESTEPFGSFEKDEISREISEINRSGARNGASVTSSDEEIPMPPEMMPIPTATGAPISPASFGQQAPAQKPAQPVRFGSARASSTGFDSAFPNELPPSPTQFSAEQLDQLAKMVPPLPEPSAPQFPPQRMQQSSQTQFQARQQPSQQRPARFSRKKEELKV